MLVPGLGLCLPLTAPRARKGITKLVQSTRRNKDEDEDGDNDAPDNDNDDDNDDDDGNDKQGDVDAASDDGDGEGITAKAEHALGAAGQFTSKRLLPGLKLLMSATRSRDPSPKAAHGHKPVVKTIRVGSGRSQQPAHVDDARGADGVHQHGHEGVDGGIGSRPHDANAGSKKASTARPHGVSSAVVAGEHAAVKAVGVKSPTEAKEHVVSPRGRQMLKSASTAMRFAARLARAVTCRTPTHTHTHTHTHSRHPYL